MLIMGGGGGLDLASFVRASSITVSATQQAIHPNADGVGQEYNHHDPSESFDSFEHSADFVTASAPFEIIPFPL